MYLKTLALAVIGVSSVAGFAPAVTPALRTSTAVNANVGNGPPSWRKTNPNNGFYQTPYDPKVTQNFDLKKALNLEDGPVDTSYQKPPSSFNFGGAQQARPAAKAAAKAAAKPAAKAAAKPAARAPVARGRQATGTGRLGSARR